MIYRKVLCSERLPETDGEYLSYPGIMQFRDGTFWDNDEEDEPIKIEWWLEPDHKIEEKAKKYDELEETIGKFYDEDSEGDLGDIGEAAAMHFGFL